MHNIQKKIYIYTFDPFVLEETIDEGWLDGTYAAAPSPSSVATFHALFTATDFKACVFFFLGMYFFSGASS